MQTNYCGFIIQSSFLIKKTVKYIQEYIAKK